MKAQRRHEIAKASLAVIPRLSASVMSGQQAYTGLTARGAGRVCRRIAAPGTAAAAAGEPLTACQSFSFPGRAGSILASTET